MRRVDRPRRVYASRASLFPSFFPFALALRRWHAGAKSARRGNRVQKCRYKQIRPFAYLIPV